MRFFTFSTVILGLTFLSQNVNSKTIPSGSKQLEVGDDETCPLEENLLNLENKIENEFHDFEIKMKNNENNFANYMTNKVEYAAELLHNCGSTCKDGEIGPTGKPGPTGAKGPKGGL